MPEQRVALVTGGNKGIGLEVCRQLATKGLHVFLRVINVSSGVSILSEMESYAPAYSISKTALNALTRQLASAGKSKGIVVNSVTPGWVKTDMGGASAPRTVEQGADSIVWLATEAPGGLTGRFIQERKVIDW